MLRSGHQTALNRVLVNIIQLLQHHLVTANFLRMGTFLPNLMPTLCLMFGAKILKLIQ